MIDAIASITRSYTVRRMPTVDITGIHRTGGSDTISALFMAITTAVTTTATVVIEGTVVITNP